MQKKIPLVYPQGYAVQGMEILGKYGRPMKPDRRDVFKFQVEGDKPICANRFKVIWAARQKVDIRKIPKDYSFREVNGIILVETFSDRMSNTRKALNQEIKVKYEDYDFIEQFASLAKKMIDGEPDAKAKLFCLLNGKRDELILYARHASGGVSQQKAILYTDMAIAKVYDLITSRTFAVASPIASIKWHINHLIKANRKKNYDDNNTNPANPAASPSRGF